MQNLEDESSVLVVGEASERVLAAFETWLRTEGSPKSVVEGCSVQERVQIDSLSYFDFRILQ